MSESNVASLSINKFYGDNNNVKNKIKAIEEKCGKKMCSESEKMPRMPQRILGPSQHWAEFWKQANALDMATSKATESNPLSTFVYEKSNGNRKFIVAHPEVFWWYFTRTLPAERRCAYEVIPADSPCCLYLDLEFQKELNPDRNGPQMTGTLMKIICFYYKKYWGIICNETHVINLDSTNTTKFSRHLIFRIKNLAFKSNIHAGRFIKIICSDIEDYLATNCNSFHDVLSFFSRQELQDLFILTEKKQKLFIDTGVYTRNRHFRIYKATKWGKLSHLTVAQDCKFVPVDENENKELQFFLESLIAYFPCKKDLTFLELDELTDTQKYTQSTQSTRTSSEGYIKESPYPKVDEFILSLVHPGSIRTILYFKESQTIVYDIIGNRYCANIGRAHKSNNIYWIADLKKCQAYQKCHDSEDCKDFKSEPTAFPIELSFQIDEQDEEYFFSIPSNSSSPNHD